MSIFIFIFFKLQNRYFISPTRDWINVFTLVSIVFCFFVFLDFRPPQLCCRVGRHERSRPSSPIYMRVVVLSSSIHYFFVNYFDSEPVLDEVFSCPKGLHVWLVLPLATLVWWERKRCFFSFFFFSPL